MSGGNTVKFRYSRTQKMYIYSTLSIAQPLGEKKNNLRLSPTKIKNKCEEGRDLERKVSKGSKTYR